MMLPMCTDLPQYPDAYPLDVSRPPCGDAGDTHEPAVGNELVDTGKVALFRGADLTSDTGVW